MKTEWPVIMVKTEQNHTDEIFKTDSKDYLYLK